MADKRGPSQGWFAVAGVVVLLGIAGSLYPGWQAATAVRTPVVLAAGSPTEVGLDRDGLMIFGSDWTSQVSCKATHRNGAGIALERVQESEKIVMKGREWVGLLRSVEPVPPGTYVVTCAEDPRGITFSVGARAGTTYLLVMLLTAVASIVVSLTIAALIVLVVLARWRRAPV